MAQTWLRIRVELLGGGGVEYKTPPGRVFLVGPRHSFADLAEAIDVAFARWDLGHLHGFELGDGRRVGMHDPDHPDGWLNESVLKVTKEIGPGEAFEYTFDFGDNWRHRCETGPEWVDPLSELGERPIKPLAVWGWGSIPDQYGRTSPGE